MKLIDRITYSPAEVMHPNFIENILLYDSLCKTFRMTRKSYCCRLVVGYPSVEILEKPQVILSSNGYNVSIIYFKISNLMTVCLYI